MTKNFKITIEYDGTGYHGWQWGMSTAAIARGRTMDLTRGGSVGSSPSTAMDPESG